MSSDKSLDIQHEVQRAFDDRSPLTIKGAGSKDFYGNPTADHTTLETSAHTGVTSYEPTELVITARCGTPLEDIESVLDENNQVLPFEPPHFANTSTLGGVIASGLSGPSRPYTGSVRDALLGVQCINGKGEILSFGGQVIKNVAGYDVSRLMAGSLGTLSVLLEMSLRVIPKPEREQTLVLEQDADSALQTLNNLSNQALPVSASSYHDEQLRIRLSGNEAAVNHAAKIIGDDGEQSASDFWEGLRNHTLDFFADSRPLWRLSLPPATPLLNFEDDSIIDWGGAQRWLKSDVSAETIRAVCDTHGGHATLYNPGASGIDAFQSLSPSVLALHKRLKHSFDPHGILNPGRMYKDV